MRVIPRSGRRPTGVFGEASLMPCGCTATGPAAASRPPFARAPREAHDADRDRRAPAVEIAIAVTLVAAEDQDVTGSELPAFAGGGQLDAPALAGQVLARAGGVRDTGQGGSGRQLHARHLEARNRLRQQRPEPHALAATLG